MTLPVSRQRLPASNPPRVLLFGSDDGNYNIGDQAMLLNTVARIRRTFPGCPITVVARKPDRLPPLGDVRRVASPRGIFIPTERSPLHRLPGFWRLWRAEGLWRGRQFIHAGQALHRTGRMPAGTPEAAAALLRLIHEADLVVNYGSGGLNDIWTQANVYSWCFCYLAARAMEKRVVVTGQGIGPLSHPVDRWLLCKALNEVDVITLRDCRDSAELLQRGGVRRPPVRISADDAASLPRASQELVQDALTSEGVPSSRPLAAFHFRGTTFDREVGERERVLMAAVADRIVEMTSGHVLFVSMGFEVDGDRVDDRIAANGVVAQMRHAERATVLRNVYDPGMVKGFVGEADLAIGTSYHFQLFALMGGKPTIGLYKGPYYRQKARGLFGHFGLEEAIFDLETVDPAAVARRAVAALEDRERIAAHQKEVASRLSHALDETWLEIQGWFDREQPLNLALSEMSHDSDAVLPAR